MLSTRLLALDLSFRAKRASEDIGVKNAIGFAVIRAVEISFQVVIAGSPK